VTHRNHRTPLTVVAVILVALLAAACGDEVSHENLDKWMQTEKGPGKIKDALRDTGIDPDLSAHAAENLLIIREDGEVRAAFEKMPDDRRAKVLAKLVPRLWALARIEGELTGANDQQTAAKDLLFELRSYADDAAKAQIDTYLIEWYTGGYYEGRAVVGRWSGSQVLRALGKAAGPAMVKAANAVVGAPEQGGKRIRVGDELLLGLAVTGDADAAKYVLDLLALDRGDDTLPERSISALFMAYVEPPGGLFEKADPAGLAPNVEQLARVALDPSSTNRMVNDAVGVLGAAGMPHCLKPLVQMINLPREDARFMWVGVNNGLRCGGPGAVTEILHAMPTGAGYEHEAFEGGVVGEIARMTPKAEVLSVARDLLDDDSWVARWAGIEVLAKLGAKEDAAKIEALSGDKTRLRGYWGDQSELPKAERKAEMTLGKRAADLAKGLAGS
jgi:hypothetical protein